MISNTDSTPFIYSTEYMPVKAYKDTDKGQCFPCLRTSELRIDRADEVLRGAKSLVGPRTEGDRQWQIRRDSSMRLRSTCAADFQLGSKWFPESGRKIFPDLGIRA